MYENLLEVLAHIEENLPPLLHSLDGWQSLDIDYEPPRVERLYRDLEGYRLCLHRIHPCSEALFHPHPWPSAVKIVSGRYEMAVGYGEGPLDPLKIATMVLTEGSSYEMPYFDGWHYVKPLGGPSLSVMVMGKPWPERHPGEKTPGGKLGPLSEKKANNLLWEFRNRYPE